MKKLIVVFVFATFFTSIPFAGASELLTYTKCQKALSEPYCGAIGTKNEGWYQNGGLMEINGSFAWDNCQCKTVACEEIGTSFEGWYIEDEAGCVPSYPQLLGRGRVCYWGRDAFQGYFNRSECMSYCDGRSDARNCSYDPWPSGLSVCVFDKKKCTQTATISTGFTLSIDKPYSSPDGKKVLIAQQDGNLVLYPEESINAKDAIWASGTDTGSPNRIIFQNDGNFVVYRGNSGTALWSSKTANRPNAVLHIGNNGHLYIIENGNILWES